MLTLSFLLSSRSTFFLHLRVVVTVTISLALYGICIRRVYSIVPLKAYFNDRNKVKFEIALCRGKNVRDKRADIKEREFQREAGRIMKNFRL